MALYCSIGAFLSSVWLEGPEEGSLIRCEPALLRWYGGSDASKVPLLRSGSK